MSSKNNNLPTNLNKQVYSIGQVLDEMFPEQKHAEKPIKHARKIMGEAAKQYSDSDIKSILTNTKFLAQSWLNDFERESFDGKTLDELLNEK